MEDKSTFSVIYAGKLRADYDAATATEGVAQLFKFSAEKAAALISKERVIKKNLSLKSAHTYKSKLEALGLTITLKREQIVASAPPSLGLSLEPINNKPQELSLQPLSHEPQNEHLSESQTSTQIVCPKCGLSQHKQEQCVSCGVFLSKIMTDNLIAEAPPSRKIADRYQQVQDDDEAPSTGLPLSAIGAATAAALVGALVWKFISVVFGYELGLIAWGIGGAVGMSAAMLGGRGLNTGILCAVLAVCSITGGKYLTMENFRSDYSSLLGEEYPADAIAIMFQAEQEMAQEYQAQVSDEQSRREFMIDYGYSEASEPENITKEEFDSFKNDTEVYYQRILSGELTSENWLEKTIGDELETLSTWELVKEDLGFIDLLFLFLGVGTAFRLGVGRGI